MSITYLKAAYILLTVVMVVILIIIGVKTITKTFLEKALATTKKRNLVVGLLLWHVYVYAVSYTGILDNFSFPPRFFLLLILPQFIFTGIFVYKNRNNKWIANLPEHWLIFYQSFRILIESIFVVSVAYAILNKEVTIEGYNFDMIFAYTAPIIGYLALRKLASIKVLIVWNYIGLVVIGSIIFLFLSSVYNPQIFGSQTMLLPESAVKYPYILVAGFLMPSAVFIHVLSIVQLSKSNKLTIN